MNRLDFEVTARLNVVKKAQVQMSQSQPSSKSIPVDDSLSRTV